MNELFDKIEELEKTNKSLASALDILEQKLQQKDNIIKEVREICEPFVEWGECTINGKILKQIVSLIDKGE